MLGSSYGAQPTRSVGTVEYVYREPRTSLLQLTNIVFPGNSGAAALNAQGQLIGIVQGEMGAPDAGTARAEGSRRPSGMSFVMPIGQLRPVYESLKRDRPHAARLPGREHVRRGGAQRGGRRAGRARRPGGERAAEGARGARGAEARAT